MAPMGKGGMPSFPMTPVPVPAPTQSLRTVLRIRLLWDAFTTVFENMGLVPVATGQLQGA